MKQRVRLSEGQLNRILKETIQQGLYEARKALTEEQKFEKWKKLFDEYMNDMIEGLQSEYLDNLGLSIYISPDYDFTDTGWLAVYEKSANQIKEGIIRVGVNYPLLYSEMRKRRMDKDEDQIEAQACVTIGHEIGHGLVEYIKILNIDQSILAKCPNLTIIKKCRSNKEEKIVEEFGEYQCDYITGVYDSLLDDALCELRQLNSQKNEE